MIKWNQLQCKTKTKTRIQKKAEPLMDSPRTSAKKSSFQSSKSYR
uniref:Uncharacterized protein MANES_03G192300 n=1 Tax=Rhizophora mucronata TaxID=61149 RepID=A0A2P2M2I6_RHIMU